MTHPSNLPRLSDIAPSAAVDLFDRIHAWVTRFVALPTPQAADAITAWIVHAWCLDAFDTSPRLAFLSPEPGSGKTRALETVEALVPNAMNTFNCSVAVLYRSMGTDPDTGDSMRPTILLDEADAIFGARASKDHEDLRALLNAGYRRGSTVQRLAWRGSKTLVETFPAFSAVAIAGLDDLPETVMTRSVVVRMKRRAASEHVQPYRERDYRSEAEAIVTDIRRWMSEHMQLLDRLAGNLPPGIEDRKADVWEPLILVGDAHSQAWSRRIRAAAVAMAGDSRSTRESLGIRLLADLRDVFDGQPAMFTADLLEALHAIEDAPWSDIRGRLLDSRGLSNRLQRYQVHAKLVRIHEVVKRGYTADDLYDAWERYLPPHAPQEGSVTSVTDVTDPPPSPDDRAALVTHVTDVTHASHSESGADLLCVACGEPMTADFYGDGRHPTCVETRERKRS